MPTLPIVTFTAHFQDALTGNSMEATLEKKITVPPPSSTSPSSATASDRRTHLNLTTCHQLHNLPNGLRPWKNWPPPFAVRRKRISGCESSDRGRWT